jgi:hypothetical protein
VGPGIYNLSGERMHEAEVFAFRTALAAGSGRITDWQARYKDGRISVSWATEGTGNVTVVPRYRANRWQDNSFIYDGIKDEWYIRDSGSNSGSINEYQIFLDLYVEGVQTTAFRIWNVEGMETSMSNPLMEIKTAQDLAAIETGNASKKYALVNSIVVEDHAPIGATGDAFTGIFYGNGYTVTIESFVPEITGYAKIGFFGEVSGNALIRDLTVDYDDVTLSALNEDVFFLRVWHGNIYVDYYGSTAGGIAGYVSEGAKLINVLIKGNLAIATGVNIAVGGIIGMAEGTSLLELTDIYSGIEINVNPLAAGQNSITYIFIGGIIGNNNSSTLIASCVFKGILNTNASYNTHIGGIIGYHSTPDNGTASVSDCLAAGNIKANINNEVNLIAGGFFGYFGSGTNAVNSLTNSFFDAGEIKIEGSLRQLYLGGFIGQIYGTSKLNNTGTLGGKIITIELFSLYTYAGGFCGSNGSDGEIRNAFSLVDMMIQGNTSSSPQYGGAYPANAGGFIGQNNGTIEACYAAGEVRVLYNNIYTAGTYIKPVYVGGFAGQLSAPSGIIRNCYALGDVLVDNNTLGRLTTYAGGLVGYNLGGTISNCFSTGNVIAQSSSTNETYSGGIVGRNTVYSSIVGNITNTAALGTKIVAADSGTTKGAGRVTGNNTGTLSNNYAIYDMKVGANDTYHSGLNLLGDPAGFVSHFSADVPTTNTGVTAINGAPAQISDIQNVQWWLNTLKFNRKEGETGLGSIENVWDFSGVEGRGYPLLRGLAGQR